MMIKKGMNIKDVMEARKDVVLVDSDIIDGDRYDDYEANANDGNILCIDTINDVIVEICKAMW